MSCGSWGEFYHRNRSPSNHKGSKLFAPGGVCVRCKLTHSGKLYFGNIFIEQNPSFARMVGWSGGTSLFPVQVQEGVQETCTVAFLLANKNSIRAPISPVVPARVPFALCEFWLSRTRNEDQEGSNYLPWQATWNILWGLVGMGGN